MGKPTFDLCYSEETVLQARKRVHALALGTKSVGFVVTSGEAVFGLAEINRRYLFLESIEE
jgi:hypothetical protein